MSETKFIHELRKSIEHYAKINGVGPAPFYKVHGSAAMSSIPDILGCYNHTSFLMECKVREKPKRKFNLMAGLTSGQKAFIRGWTVAGGYAFLAVRLGKEDAIIINFWKHWRIHKSFPLSINTVPFGKSGAYIIKDSRAGALICRASKGLWENIGDVITDENISL